MNALRERSLQISYEAIRRSDRTLTILKHIADRHSKLLIGDVLSILRCLMEFRFTAILRSRPLSKVVTNPHQNPNCCLPSDRSIYRSSSRKLRRQGHVNSSSEQQAHLTIIPR